MSRYHAQLETLQLAIAFTGYEPAHPPSADSVAHPGPEPHRHAPLLAFLSSVQPGHLRKLTLILRPQVTRRTCEPPNYEEEIPGDDIPWRTYLISRSRMISKVIGHDVKAILDQERFVNLRELEFEIEDDVCTHDEDWWLEKLAAVLPRWPQRLGVKVEPRKYSHACRVHQLTTGPCSANRRRSCHGAVAGRRGRGSRKCRCVGSIADSVVLSILVLERTFSLYHLA